MNKFLVILLIFPLFLFGQKRKKFRKGAVIIERTASKNYTAPRSIYFVFKGNPHLVYYYKDLQNNLEEVFKKANVKLGFKYLLTANNPLKVDVENIPKTTEKYTDFQSIVAISLKFNNSINSSNIHFRKQNYNLYLELVAIKSTPQS